MASVVHCRWDYRLLYLAPSQDEIHAAEGNNGQTWRRLE